MNDATCSCVAASHITTSPNQEPAANRVPSGFSDLDELTERALKETDRARRRQLYHELQRTILSGAPSAVPVGWVEGFHFVDKRVRGYKFAPTVYDNNTMMKVWLAQ